MLGTVGSLQKTELIDDGEDNKWKRGIVTYDLKEDAQTAIERFHETAFEGTRLQMICPEPGPNSPLKQDKSRSRKMSCDGRKKLDETKRVDDGTFPVRIVVPSNMIGAIIGKEGKTIRKITDTTGARVDIHRKDNAHSLKKEITVFGSAEVCNQAIAMILQVMQDERATLSKPQMLSYKSAVLELLVHHNLLIKMFGDRYTGLSQLMERTMTEITITQSDELGKKSSTDRHVNILGTPEACCAAQLEISAMNKDAFEVDMARIYQITQAGHGNNPAPPHHRSPGTYNMNQYSRQMNQQRSIKMRYGPENPVHGNVMSPPGGRPQPQLSPNALLRLLSDLRNKNVSMNDYQREQMVLAGQQAHDSYMQQQQQQQQQHHQGSPPIPSPNFQTRYNNVISTPKRPVSSSMVESPYLDNMLQGYSPYPPRPVEQRSPVKSVRNFQEDYENLCVASFLEGLGLEDIIGTHDGSCDSGIQASPEFSSFPRSNYIKHPSSRSPCWPVTDPVTPQHPQPNYSYMSASSEENPSFSSNGYGMNSSTNSLKETSDFLSNSLLRGPGSQWSDNDDSLQCSPGSLTIENSNVRREMSQSGDSGKSYYNQVHGTQTPFPNWPSAPYSGVYGGNNMVEWNTAIPLYVGQKIDTIKQRLEQNTQTRIELRRCPQNEKLVNLKSAGTPDGIQQLQFNIQMACKEAKNLM